MADPYIDAHETQLYGKFARDQLAAVCVGLIPDLDQAVHFCSRAQAKVDAEMAAVLARQPGPVSRDDRDRALEDARDVLVRFGSHLDSIKGHPVDPDVFFRGDAPSVLARRRLAKLVAALEHIVQELPKHAAKLKDSKAWLADLADVHARLAKAEKAERSARVEKLDARPEVAQAREKWLEVYGANKRVVGGVLAHAGKLQLLPAIFDDLAEAHRVSGVSDTTGAPPAPPTAPSGTGPSRPTP